MTLLRLLMAGGLLAAVVYSVLAVVALLRFPIGRARQRAASRPFLSLLKPIRGLDPLRPDEVSSRSADLRRDLELNLATFFTQDYAGEFEILFGFQDPDDPAIAIVEDMRARFPHVRSEVVRVPGARGPNKKASVLAALSKRAQGEILVASDQDMRVDDGYLEAVAAGFDAPDVGVVTCPYRTRTTYDLGGTMEALTIDVDFIPSTLVARTLDAYLSFALGATMAVRRETLRAIGGFQGLEPYLADDFLLGNRALQAGWRVEMSPYVIENVMPPTSLIGYFSHHLRWSRGYRVCRPLGYLFSVLMNGTVFSLGLGWALGAPQVVGGWLAWRLCVAAFLFGRVAGRRIPMGWLLLVPVKDVVSFALWALAVGGNRVSWAGASFTLSSDGRLIS